MTEIEQFNEVASIIATMVQQEQGEAFNPIPPKIKIVAQGGVFQNENTGDLLKEIKGIIIASTITRALWAKNGDKTPVCSSIGGRFGKSHQPDVVAGGVCANCPMNQFGTGTNPDGSPNAGKACKEARLLLVLPDTWPVPATLSLPPTSIRAFDKYASGMMASRLAYFAVETTIALEKITKGAQTYSVATFTPGARLDAAALSNVYDLRQLYAKYVAENVMSDEEVES